MTDESDVGDQTGACEGNFLASPSPYLSYCRMVRNLGDYMNLSSLTRPTILIELPKDRSKLGVLRLLDHHGHQRFGPVPVLARANAAVARDHANESRAQLKPFGDPPTGTFVGIALESPLLRALRPDTSADIGAGVIVLLAGSSLAESRPALIVEGGDTSVNGQLRPTAGGIRVCDSDMKELLHLIQLADLGLLEKGLSPQEQDERFKQETASDGVVPGLRISKDAAVDVKIVERDKHTFERIFGGSGPDPALDRLSDLPRSIEDPLPIPSYGQYVSAYLSKPPDGPVKHGDTIKITNNLTYVGDTIGGFPNGDGEEELVTKSDTIKSADGSAQEVHVHFVGKFVRGYYISGTVTSQGVSWTGSFVAGRPNGPGTLTTSGYTLQATWDQGLPEGSAKYERRDGASCTVTLVHAVATGPASCVYANGDKFSGMFKDWLRDGPGQYGYKSGETYDGSFLMDLPNGHGKYAWTNRDSFDGEYRAGLRNGPGTLRRHDGQVFTGTWLNDQPVAVNARYPISAEQEDTGQETIGDGHHMSTYVKISIDGTVDGVTWIDNHVKGTGFCGKVAIWGFDSSKNVVYRGGPGPDFQWCVDGQWVPWGSSMRRDIWTAHVPADVLPKLAGISILQTSGWKDPWALLSENLRQAAPIIQAIVGALGAGSSSTDNATGVQQ